MAEDKVKVTIEVYGDEYWRSNVKLDDGRVLPVRWLEVFAEAGETPTAILAISHFELKYYGLAEFAQYDPIDFAPSLWQKFKHFLTGRYT